MKTGKIIKVIATLILISSALPLTAKPKNTFTYPDFVSEYLVNIPENKQIYAICKLKGKEPGDILYGPFVTKEQLILVWIDADLKSQKKVCVTRKGNLYTKNIESYDRKTFEEVSTDYASLSREDIYKKYFVDEVNESSIQGILPEQADNLEENIETEGKIPEGTVAAEPETTPVTPVIEETKIEVIEKTEEKAPAPEEQTPIQPEKTEPVKTEEPASVITLPVITKQEAPKETLVIPAPVTVITETEPAKVEEPEIVFELPISKSNNSSVSRYQKEYLQDYAPKKTIQLPEDTIESPEVKIENPDQRDEFGRTLLMKAAQAGNNWEINSLISSGADVNATDNDGWTPLMYAVRYQQNTPIVTGLINNGAKVKVKNNYELSPLMIAASYNGNPEIVKTLLNHYSASEKEVLQSFVLLLSDNSTSEYGKLAKIDIFLEKSIPVNSFYKGKTPLMYAAEFSSSTLIIKKILDSGAVTSIRSTEGKTAFDYASENNNLKHDSTYWELNKK